MICYWHLCGRANGPAGDAKDDALPRAPYRALIGWRGHDQLTVLRLPNNQPYKQAQLWRASIISIVQGPSIPRRLCTIHTNTPSELRSPDCAHTDLLHGTHYLSTHRGYALGQLRAGLSVGASETSLAWLMNGY